MVLAICCYIFCNNRLYWLLIVKKDNIMITKREKVLLMSVAFLFLFTIGAIFNIQAVMNNKGMMPMYVNNPYSFSADDQHFTFTNKSDVNLFLLTDIIHIPLTNSYSSIGDFFIWIGLGCFIVYIFKWGWLVGNRSKKKRKPPLTLFLP